MGEVTGGVRKEILLIKVDTDPTVIQHDDERYGPVKALALLSSLPVSWKVFCTTFANNCLNLNLDEIIGQVLT